MSQHVVPTEDLIDHEFTQYCVCGPTVEDGGAVVVHHSLDGRELTEGGDA